MQNEKKERTPDQPAVESDCYPPIFAYQLVSLDWPNSSLVLHGALSTSYRVTNLVRVKDGRWRADLANGGCLHIYLSPSKERAGRVQISALHEYNAEGLQIKAYFAPNSEMDWEQENIEDAIFVVQVNEDDMWGEDTASIQEVLWERIRYAQMQAELFFHSDEEQNAGP